MKKTDVLIAAHLAEPDLRAQFLAKVDRREPNECWPWLGSRFPKGYGAVRARGLLCQAHRLAYVLAKGEIERGSGYHGSVVMHTCDNPPCCNPDHLVIGTVQENNRDRAKKRRSADQHGSRHANAKLSEADVSEMRRLRAEGVKCKDLALRFGISEPHASNVTLGKFCWRHV